MANQSPSLRTLEPNLVQWLLDNQDLSGGWGEHKGGGLSAFNTAEAVMALAVADPVDSTDIQPAIRKAVSFLRKERDRSPMIPPDSGAWYRTVKVHGDEHRGADIVRTALIVGALSRAGEDTTVVASAVDWLIKRQLGADDDWGWGYQRGSQSKILPTCFALLALIMASPTGGGGTGRDAVERGLKHLTEKFRNKDGSFGVRPLAGAHTTYACLVLQAARDRGFSTVAQVEDSAIKWLLKNQDDALAPVEEVIETDPKGLANYPFMFTMEALLLRVLANSQNDAHRNTKLWIDTQRSMHGAYDENTGGFYGRRVFSWSTANGLYAIRCSEEKLAGIPAREPEAGIELPRGGIKVGYAITGFALVLVVVAVYLTKIGKFGTLQVSFFGLLVLACLVAYGAIGEKTFGELVPSFFSFKGKSDQNE